MPHYSERLKLLDLIPISSEFIRSDLMTLYKLINNTLPVPSVSLRFSSRVPHRLLLSRVNSNTGRKYFINRASCIWNRISTSDSVASIHSFRKFLSSEAFISSLQSQA